MTRNRNISWLIRICVAVFWFLGVADAIPATSALIDAEVWLTNHFADPILFAFASGLLLPVLAGGRLRGDVRGLFAAYAPAGSGRRWAMRIVLLLFWLLMVTSLVPAFSALIDGEVWLTGHFADPILLAFASGLFATILLSQGLREDVLVLLARPEKPADVSVSAVDESLAEAAALQALADEGMPGPAAEVVASVPAAPAPALVVDEPTAMPPAPEPWELAPDVVVAEAVPPPAEEVVAEALPEATEVDSGPVPEVAAEAVTEVEPVVSETETQSEAPLPAPEPWELTPDVVVAEAAPPPAEEVVAEALPETVEVDSDPVPEVAAEAVTDVEPVVSETETQSEAPLPAPEPWELTPDVVVAEDVPVAMEESVTQAVPEVAAEFGLSVSAEDVPAEALPPAEVFPTEYGPLDEVQPLDVEEAEPADVTDVAAVSEPVLSAAEHTGEVPLPQFLVDSTPIVVQLAELGQSAPLLGRDPLPDVPVIVPEGRDGEELPAPDYAHWDTVNSFAAWQVAWLWNDWEPVEEETENGPVLATYLRLEGHLSAGTIRDVKPVNGAWTYSEISRQTLVNYAILSGERPKFLFAGHRGWLSQRLREMQSRDVSLSEISDYMVYGDVKLTLYKVLKVISSEAVAVEIRRAMQKGLCEGIARRVENGVTYGYERIPRYLWYILKIDWLGALTGRGMSYTGLMVKFKPGYLDPSQAEETTPSSVAAYDEIEKYIRAPEGKLPSAAAGVPPLASVRPAEHGGRRSA